jgi:hypothetical protein
MKRLQIPHSPLHNFPIQRNTVGESEVPIPQVMESGLSGVYHSNGTRWNITLLSPQNNSTVDELTPTLIWNKESNSQSYTVQVSTDEFSTFVVNEILTDTTFTTPTLNYSTTYRWRVRGSNTTGDGEWTQWGLPPKWNPLEPLLYSHHRTTLPTYEVTPTLIWNRESNSQSYTVQVSTDEFTTLIIDETVTDTTFTTPQLSYSTEYNWRVRGSNTTGDGEWTQWVFTTQMEPVGTITLLSPQNNSTVDELTPTLIWNKESNSQSYTVQISTDEFSTFVVNQTLTDTTFTTPTLNYSTTYRWRVRGSNTTGDGEWTSWGFTTQMESVGTITLLSPQNNSTVDDPSLQL